MSKLESLITVEHNNNRYTIVGIKHSGNKLPILLDRSIYKNIKKLDKKWYINDKNHVYCLHGGNDLDYQVYLHDVVLRLKEGKKYIPGKPIIHINNIHFDNRYNNLSYDLPNKDFSKNNRKKKRTINLRKQGINVNELPTYLWYLKPDTSHGSRFTVEIPNELSWRTTSSKKVSLKYKLEEAKKFLRYTKKIRPDIFKNYSMNGDMTEKGLQLYKEYVDIIKIANFTMNEPDIKNTDFFLRENVDRLNDFEKYLLNKFNPKDGTINVNKYYKEFIKNTI